MKQLVFASHNQGKIKEVQALLEPFSITVLGADEANVPDIEETGTTFMENALLKARHAYQITGIPSLADDSGLCISALDNAPGLFSARFAAQNGGYPQVFSVLNQLLSEKNDKTAFFYCQMALVWGEQDIDQQFFDGRMDGCITDEPKGLGGFGYDPIFIPNGFDEPVATLPAEVKNSISHRAKALKKAVDFLAKQQNIWPK